MGKLPAFLFYPKDWLTDNPLCVCSKGAKGVWADILCTMFGAPNRGVLAFADGRSWTDNEIAEAIGGNTATNLEYLAELLEKGVVHRNQRGSIFSRRMVRDEADRQAATARKRKERSVTPNVTPVVTPLSGTANGSSSEVGVDVDSKKEAVFKRKKDLKIVKELVEPYLLDIYKAYPRKEARPDALKAIAAALDRLLTGRHSEAGLFTSMDDAVVYMLSRVRMFARSPAGQAGSFTPHPATWFNGHRYLDDESWWQRGEKQQQVSTQAARLRRNYEVVTASLRVDDSQDDAVCGGEDGQGTDGGGGHIVEGVPEIIPAK